MSVVVVDWLGRGGIAQTSEAWAIELGRRGVDVEVVTRANRELGSGAVTVTAPVPRAGRLRAHRDVAIFAAARIRARKPSAVVVQNYVIPLLEQPVYDAATEVGARVVTVTHNARGHSLTSGTRAGLRTQLRRADTVVAHSDYVRERIAASTGRDDIVVLPLPVPVGLLRHAPDAWPPSPPAEREQLRAAHVGVLRRGYKGRDLVGALAEVVDDWEFVVAGVGAPRSPGLTTVDRFLDPAELVELVSRTDVMLLPYRRATQSAVVVLARALGAVPVATAVGALPEQVEDGVDGVLLPSDALIGDWQGTLEHLRDDDTRKRLAAAGERRVWSEHDRFCAGVVGLVQ
jgi:glycosyltransferase involved in cell wall biosynthesis